MINIQQDIKCIVFNGDYDQPVIITKADTTTFSTTGILQYQVVNTEVENVTISDARKLTLTLSTKALSDIGCTVEETDTFTINGKSYGLVNPTPFDNKCGVLTLQLGDL